MLRCWGGYAKKEGKYNVGTETNWHKLTMIQFRTLQMASLLFR